MRIPIIVALLLSGTAAGAAKEEILFDGKDLSQWTLALEETGFNKGGKGKVSDFVKLLSGGVLEIRPQMMGVLMTRKDYLNYKFHAEWRWPTDVDPKLWRNGGLFIKIMAPYTWDRDNALFPRMYEVQVQKPYSGDLWVLSYHPTKLKTTPEQTYKPFGTREPDRYLAERRHHNLKDAEKPFGEWNALDFEVNGKDIKVWVNGELVNQGTDLVALPGRIGLISEGPAERFSPIQWRNIRVTPLD